MKVEYITPEGASDLVAQVVRKAVADKNEAIDRIARERDDARQQAADMMGERDAANLRLKNGTERLETLLAGVRQQLANEQAASKRLREDNAALVKERDEARAALGEIGGSPIHGVLEEMRRLREETAAARDGAVNAQQNAELERKRSNTSARCSHDHAVDAHDARTKADDAAAEAKGYAHTASERENEARGHRDTCRELKDDLTKGDVLKTLLTHTDEIGRLSGKVYELESSDLHGRLRALEEWREGRADR